jgi:hypothetical protein
MKGVKPIVVEQFPEQPKGTDKGLPGTELVRPLIKRGIASHVLPADVQVAGFKATATCNYIRRMYMELQDASMEQDSQHLSVSEAKKRLKKFYNHAIDIVMERAAAGPVDKRSAALEQLDRRDQVSPDLLTQMAELLSRAPTRAPTRVASRGPTRHGSRRASSSSGSSSSSSDDEELLREAAGRLTSHGRMSATGAQMMSGRISLTGTQMVSGGPVSLPPVYR